MTKIELSQTIAAPVDQVFRLFADLEGAADNIGAIQKLELLTDGPVGKGTRFRETRVVFKREATEEMEITAFDPPNGYTVGCESCGAVFTTVFRFAPEGSGTRVDVELEARPVSFFAKVMSPLSRFMLSSCRKAMEQDFADLRGILEGERQAATAAAT